MATTKTLVTPISDIVLVVVNPVWSLDRATIGAGHIVKTGTVLAKVGSDHLPIDFAGTGTADEAVAVAYEETDATAAAKPGLVLARGGVVSTNGLIWPTGATTEQKAAATAQLLALGIVTKTAL